MSHNIRLSGVKFTDLVSLGNVIKDVSKGQARLEAEQKTFRTYRGQDPSCDAAIVLPGYYDIGLKRTGDGYEPIMESALMYGGSILGVQGSPLGLVQQEFALREAEYEAAQRGYTASREEGKNGRITLRIGVPD